MRLRPIMGPQCQPALEVSGPMFRVKRSDGDGATDNLVYKNRGEKLGLARPDFSHQQ